MVDAAIAAGDDAPFDVDGPPLRLTGRRMRQLGRPFRRRALIGAGFGLAVAGTRVAEALLLARILGHVLHGRGGVAPGVIAIVGVAALRLVLLRLGARYRTTTSAAARLDLRSRLYDRLSALGPAYLAVHRTGEVEATLVDGVERLGTYYGEFWPLVLASVASVTIVLGWIAVLDPVVGLVMMGCALLVPLAPVLTARAFGSAGRHFAEGFGRLASEYLDAIWGLTTLKAFNAADRWGERLTAEGEEMGAEMTSLSGLTNMHIGFVSLGVAGGTVIGVAVATLDATHHGLGGAGLIAILLLARECFRPLADLQAAFPAAYQAVAGANGVIDLLDAAPSVTAGPDISAPPSPSVRPSAVRPSAVRPSAAGPPQVRFEDVTFAYGDDRSPALDGVSFEAPAGATVAIVGPSGAGKSTVVSLLLRFFDPCSGAVVIGDDDVRSVPLIQLRSLIAVTFQDTFLFHGSVRDNVMLGRPGASAAAVEAALRAAHAGEFVDALPHGPDTVIGERGASLSGGERQRLAIARALLADRPVLVLDEPTSSVDAASEVLIGDAIDRLRLGRTTIVIAHRLSTLRRADRIVVMDRGRIVEMGSPDDLRRADSAFGRLVSAQVDEP